jgi:murein DD-endopeptidase MepM/ murein hydrolase activator NlpD
MLHGGWVRAAFLVAVGHAALLALVHARPGLVGVVLWWIGPPLVGLATAALLAVALRSSWRSRTTPTWTQLAGFATLVAISAALAAFRTYPSSYDHRPSDVSFRLPLDGPVTVAWGGPTVAVNYHAVIPDQRWAYDLLVTENGRSFRGDGTRLEDYLAHGRPVLAPADGVVFDVRDTEPDEQIGHWQVRRATGNHVVLQVTPQQFLFIAHLQRGSIVVKPGERVRAGQTIGRVGNSGNASEPHVHLHLQDTPTPHLGEGIPLYFRDYRVNGAHVDRGIPTGGRRRRSRLWPGAFTGQVVEHVPSPWPPLRDGRQPPTIRSP